MEAYSEENLENFNKRVVAHLCDGEVTAKQLESSQLHMHRFSVDKEIMRVNGALNRRCIIP